MPSLRALLARYWAPLLALLLVLPITGLAIVESLHWFAVPFPGFLLMENAVVPTVSTFDWPAERSLVFHSQVVAVDGAPVNGSAEVYTMAGRHPAGTPLTYTFRNDAGSFERTIQSRQFTASDYLQTCGLMLFAGLVWLSFALIVGFLQPQQRLARTYMWQGIVVGLYPITGILLHRPGWAMFTTLYFAIECLFPATWIHLALVFPVERQLGGWRRLAVLAPYVVGLVFGAAVLGGFYQQPPALGAMRMTYLYAAASFVFFVANLVWSYRQTDDHRVRARVKAILPGALLAGTLAGIALIDSAFGGHQLPVQFGLLLTPAFSAAVAYALVKHDLFDVDRVVQQSFVYTVLSLLVLVGYASILSVGQRWIPATAQNPHVLGSAFVVFLALVLEPLRRGVQRVVDRLFYRAQIDYTATIRQLSEVMTTLLDLHAITNQVTREVTDAMQLESTSLALFSDSDAAVWVRHADGRMLQRSGDVGLETLAKILREKADVWDVDALIDAAAAGSPRQLVAGFLRALQVRLVVPLFFHQSLIGVLLLGPKRSRRWFGPNDVDLLRTLANQTAIAVQNAGSYAALQEITQNLDAQVQR
ncbi:MAG: GAF domain-containing protein, partial [Deltaproteobacteria bacterium]|nr:GAF domain-containing protein [Deltaproteobacteria bacterium]